MARTKHYKTYQFRLNDDLMKKLAILKEERDVSWNLLFEYLLMKEVMNIKKYDKEVEVFPEDYKWLKENRGDLSVEEFLESIINLWKTNN